MVAHHNDKKMGHQNQDATIGKMWKQYWITSLRRLLRKVVADCNYKLRRDRLEAIEWPFKYTPFHVSVGHRVEKRWVALFTCFFIFVGRMVQCVQCMKSWPP